jgi:NADPH:quinone reductase-like Zn-dependent oxidoreductase
LGGARGEIDLASLLLKRVRLVGSTLRARSADEKACIVRAFESRFGTALRAGRLRPVIDRVLPLGAAAEAHRVVQSSVHFGKVALRVD